VPVEGGIIIPCGFSLGCAFANVSLYVIFHPENGDATPNTYKT